MLWDDSGDVLYCRTHSYYSDEKIMTRDGQFNPPRHTLLAADTALVTMRARHHDKQRHTRSITVRAPALIFACGRLRFTYQFEADNYYLSLVYW